MYCKYTSESSDCLVNISMISSFWFGLCFKSMSGMLQNMQLWVSMVKISVGFFLNFKNCKGVCMTCFVRWLKRLTHSLY